MIYKRILLLYKNSTYATYFLSDQKRLAHLQGLFNSRGLKRFRKTHDNHFAMLSFVEAVLKKRKLNFSKVCRGTVCDYGRFDLVISVGGDGTFLEASRCITDQVIWGINSDPQWSVGRFCSGDPRNFERMLGEVLRGNAKVRKLNRLSLSINGTSKPMNVLNDVLVCHRNPAALSRYYLTVGKTHEEQRSSGVWVSTAAGSTGGTYSAGGKKLAQESKDFVYKPRELYRAQGIKYQLTGGVLKPSQKIKVTSLMREGVVFVDGSHVSLPFSFGETVQLGRSTCPLKAVI